MDVSLEMHAHPSLSLNLLAGFTTLRLAGVIPEFTNDSIGSKSHGNGEREEV